MDNTNQPEHLSRSWRWVTLSLDRRHVRVWQRLEKPQLGDAAVSRSDDDWVTVCSRDFEALFGFLPIEPMRVVFSALALEDATEPPS